MGSCEEGVWEKVDGDYSAEVGDGDDGPDARRVRPSIKVR